MFAKNKVTQSMLDAVNSVLEESNIDEASLKIPIGINVTRVYGDSEGYGSKKAHEVQHKNPFEKGPSKADLKDIEDKEQDAKGEKATGMTHAEYEKSARDKKEDKKEDKKKSMKKESAFTSKLLTIFKENKASGAQETFTDNNMGEGKGLIGKQKKLDKNHNGELDAQDFKMLRKDEEELDEEQLDEMINEVLSKDAPAGEWIHDFVHSDNPKFAGKSEAERKKMALGAYYGAQKEEVEQINEISKSEVEHHFNNWTNSEHAPDHHDAGDDNTIHQSALNYLKHTKEPKEKHEKIAMHIADKFHGSGIWEEVDLEEGDAQYKKTTPTKPMSDVVARGETVKDLVNRIRNPQYFGSGKVKGLDEVQEEVETSPDKNAGKITTDTLAGRVASGKLNSFKSFKTNLTTSGTQSVPSEIEHGEDTKEKEKVSTNPGPVDIKLDDKLTGPTPYTHFQKKEKVTSEEFRGEAKKLQHIRDTEQKHEIEKFHSKITKVAKKTQNEEVETINEDGWLDKYLLSKGINPKFLSQATKISHAKSHEFMAWKQSHQNESTEMPFEGPYRKAQGNIKDKSGATHTPMSRAKDLARTALKKIKQDAGNEKG
jgi:hypothetical protein